MLFFFNSFFLLTHVFSCKLGLPGGPKMAQFFGRLLTSSNINRFSKLFHCQNQEKTYNNTITIDPATPQVCRYAYKKLCHSWATLHR